MKRIFDFSAALLAALPLAALLCLLALLVKATSPGPVLHWSRRVGYLNREFSMPKFRTMKRDAPVVATHLLSNPRSHLTPIGSALRKASLDELPQIWSILKGDMSLVGPRPILSSQTDLVALRTSKGIHKLMPGLTGWAQINGRDRLSDEEKVQLDAEYLERHSFLFDLKILLATFYKVIRGEGITH